MWNNEKGFTTLEMIVVLIVVVILIGMAVVQLGSYNDKNIAIQVKSEAQIALDTANSYMMSTSNFNENELSERLERVLEYYTDDPSSERRYKIVQQNTPTGFDVEIEMVAEINDGLTIEAMIKPLKNSLYLKGVGDANIIKSLVDSGVLNE